MVNVNVLEDENGNVTGAGNNYVQITGDVRTSTDFYGEGGTINIGLTTPDSYLHGHFTDREMKILNLITTFGCPTELFGIIRDCCSIRGRVRNILLLTRV